MKFLYSVLLVAALSAASVQFAAAQSKEAAPAPAPAAAPAAPTSAPVSFKEMEWNFGSVKEGDQAKHIFTFTNNGKAPISLASVKPGCGCTTPSYTKEAIAPGKTGEIEVSYNSSGRPGQFTKGITVNFEGFSAPLNLTIKGDVTPKPADPAAPAAPAAH